MMPFFYDDDDFDTAEAYFRSDCEMAEVMSVEELGQALATTAAGLVNERGFDESEVAAAMEYVLDDYGLSLESLGDVST